MSAAGCPGGAACTCGCCAGVDGSTPRASQNRPGLSSVAHRTGTYRDFLDSMLAGLTDAARPALGELGTRDPDDPTVGLLDAWAVAADVLTFHTERAAQEAYLRTAVDRPSLVELGRLIGYRLRPGVAAETLLAFAVEPAPPTPPTLPGSATEPGATPPVVPEVVDVPVGLRVQSIPGPGEKPQTFETLEELDARRGWGAVPASTTAVGVTSTSAWLTGAALGIAAGDVLLWEVGSSWVAKVLTKVSPDPDTNRTEVRWSGALGLPAGSPQPTVFRKRLALFGHNAPQWKAMSIDFRTNYASPELPGSEWPGLDVNLGTITCVHVEGAHGDVLVGSRVLIHVPETTGAMNKLGLWSVGGVAEGSDAEFAVSGKVTHITVSGSDDLGENSRRDVVVYAVSEPLTPARRDDESPVSGDSVAVDADVSAMSEGRRIIVSGETSTGVEVTHEARVTAVAEVNGRWEIGFAPALPAGTSLVRPSVVVNANVVPAGHGESTSELLGSGRADKPHQRFALSAAPLTHVQTTGSAGSSPALEVWVDDIRWDRVDTLYEALPAERSYVLRTDPGGRDEVRFGDGAKGSRLPTGGQNVVARYRTGIGAEGNVGAGRLSNLLDRPLGLKGVANPVGAAGGADPEPASDARATMPLPVRTLGRAVSLLDYADYARTFAGVSKATASVLTLRAGPTVVVTVAFGRDGTDPAGDRLVDLAGSLLTYGDPHVQIEVLDHTRQEFRLSMKVATDPARDREQVLAAIHTAFAERFSFASMGFGESVVPSAILAVAHGVPGVVAVDLDLLYTGTAPQPAKRLTAPFATATSWGTAVPAGVLVASADPFDDLGDMP